MEYIEAWINYYCFTIILNGDFAEYCQTMILTNGSQANYDIFIYTIINSSFFIIR
jgi:hypothetical protein